MLLCLLFDRFLELIHFGWRYTDQDQTLLWYGSRETAAGRLHEPRWYGQDYNSMMESWLAAPFTRLGADPAIVLPLVTTILFLLPFLVLSVWALRSKRYLAANAILLLPIMLQYTWTMTGCMPRGWVQGIAIGILVWPLLRTRTTFGLSTSWWRGILAGLIIAIAVWNNPNVLVLIGSMLLCLTQIQDQSIPNRFHSCGIKAP
jgi:hypothetical protein